MRAAWIAAAAAALALAGCNKSIDNGYAVDVTLDVDQSVTLQVLEGIVTLDIDVQGAETFHTQFAVDNQLAGREAKFIYRPVVQSGNLTFTVLGLDQSGAANAYGQGTTALKAGKTVTMTIVLSANVPEIPDMAPPADMVCVPESDADFCARLGKTCESVTDVDNCGAMRTVASCGTCSGTTPACVNNVCSTPVCGNTFVSAGTNVMSVSVMSAQDDLLGASATGDSLLLLRPASGSVPACVTVGAPELFIADATTAGSMSMYNVQPLNAVTNLSTVLKAEEKMTLTADGLTIIGMSTDSKKFLTSSRSAIAMTDFSAAAEGEFATLNAAIPAGGTLSWPVLSADGLDFYYQVGGATTATDNGIYESVRTSTTAMFPAGTKMPADIQAFGAIMSVSPDRMTIFLTGTPTAATYATNAIFARTSVTQPYAATTGSMLPAQAWRVVPIAGCAKLIGTCEPGGCTGEDICVWSKM